MRDGEKVPQRAVFQNTLSGHWDYANDSVGKERKYTVSGGTPFYVPIIQLEPQQQTESTNTMSLQAVTILHTPKVAPGAIQATEEVLIPSVEIATTDTTGFVAVLFVGAQNAEAINKVAKTSNLRVVHRTLG